MASQTCLHLVYRAIVAFTLLATDVHAEKKQIIPLVDGVSIKTSDSIANVDVRGKSIGLGFCSVMVTGEGNTIAYAAPPQAWGPWIVLFSHVGAVNALINVDVECDTGALMEARYFPQQ